MSAGDRRIPVTVISGFLGAGKTTLLNRVLTADHGRRIGVVVNDFGTLAFDEELAGTAKAHRRVLANGCVCCSIQNDLIETMLELFDQRPSLDGVVIEASGVADPSSLVTSLRDAGFPTPPRLRGVVTVADARRVREQEQDYGGELVVKQLRRASVVVLNKCDLVSPTELKMLNDWLRRLGTRAPVVEAVHGDVPLDLLLGEDLPGGRAPEATPAAHAAFAEWLVRLDRPLGQAELERAFRRLPDGITRAKGVIELIGAERPVLVQFAGGRLDVRELAESRSQESSTLVFVGAPGAIGDEALARLFTARRG